MSKVLRAPEHWVSNAIRIDVIGCGGTGSSMLDELFRMHALLQRLEHPGLRVTAWDGDTVSDTNVGRQRFWPCDIGWNKAEILVTRYNSFGDAGWGFEDRMLGEEDCRRLNSDVIVSCVDRPEGRVMIGDIGKDVAREDTLWIDTGNGVDSGQVILGHWAGRRDGKCERVPNVIDLYPGMRGQRTEQGDSCSSEEAVSRQDFGINQRVAAEASGLLWRLIRFGELKRHGSFVYQDIGEVLPLDIDDKVWKTFAA